MNPLSEHSDLKRDLLEDTLPVGFREQLLANTCQRARRRRTIRQATQAGGGLMAVLLLGLMLFQSSRRTPETQPQLVEAAPKAYRLVTSQPGVRVVETAAVAPVRVVSSTPSGLQVVVSKPSPELELISDERLFELLRNEKFILVRHAPGEASVTFLHPE